MPRNSRIHTGMGLKDIPELPPKLGFVPLNTAGAPTHA